MTAVPDLERLLSPTRYAVYLQAVQGDHQQAENLYRRNAKVSGLLHAHIGLFEVITRNAIDQALRQWCAAQYASEAWTSESIPPNHIHTLLSRQLKIARDQAGKASRNRRPGHPRRGVSPTHDDVVTQLTMGSWSTLLGESPTCKASPAKQSAAEELWEISLQHAFAFAGEETVFERREKTGKQFQRLTELRNRVSHHENLLETNIRGRLNDMISILSAIDPNVPGWFMRGSELRSVVREDPRRRL